MSENGRFVLVIVGHAPNGMPVARVMTLEEAKGMVSMEEAIAEAWTEALTSSKGAHYWAQQED